MEKKSRTAIIKIRGNVVEKQFYATLSKSDAHRKGPRHCVCGSNLEKLLENEVCILKRLDKYHNFPKIININKENHSFKMTYCGESIYDLKKNKKLIVPNNWLEQIKNISKNLNEENIYNNDIAITNICILNEKIYLIDFGCCQPLDIKLRENYDNRDNFVDLYNLFYRLISNI